MQDHIDIKVNDEGQYDESQAKKDAEAISNLSRQVHEQLVGHSRATAAAALFEALNHLIIEADSVEFAMAVGNHMGDNADQIRRMAQTPADPSQQQ